MVIGPGKDGIAAFVILTDGELIPQNFNNEKVVVMRRGESTGRELKVVKPLGQLASPELVKQPDEPICNYTEVNNGDGNPLHQHKDETWWFYDETWAFENGPFPTYEEANDALEVYCTTVLIARENAEKNSLTSESENAKVTEDERTDTQIEQEPGLRTDTKGNGPASS